MSKYMESCMDFSLLFADDKSFYIEKSNYYTRCVSHGITTVEFIYLRNNTVYFIEAKRTMPNLQNSDSEQSISDKLQELVKKIRPSIEMFFSLTVGINSDSEFPSCFKDIDFSKHELIYLIIVSDSEYKRCKYAKEKLQQQPEIKMLSKIWKIEVRVMTGEYAIKEGLVKNFVCKLNNTGWKGYGECPRDKCIIQEKALSK